jgi:hypothetical protein
VLFAGWFGWRPRDLFSAPPDAGLPDVDIAPG